MGLEHAITAVLTAAVIGYLVKLAGRAPEVKGDVLVLRYPRFLKGFMWFGTALFGGGAIAVAVWLAVGPESDKDARTAAISLPIFAAFFVLCAVLIFMLRVTLQVDREGIRGMTAFRGERNIAWRDVAAVKWSPFNKWLVIVDRQGSKLCVSILMQGHQAAVMALRQHVPEPVWSKAVAAWEKAPKNMF